MTKENPNWSFYTTTDAAGRVYVIASYSEWVPEKRQPRIACIGAPETRGNRTNLTSSHRPRGWGKGQISLDLSPKSFG